MALLYLGGEAAQMSLQLPQAISGVFQGLLLFSLLACNVFVRYRIVWSAFPARDQGTAS
jgi:simple sugar transport system permease protein